MTSRNLRTSSVVRFLRAIVLFCMVLCLFPFTLFGTEKRPRKVVRVSYQEFSRQMIVDENNHPVSGYAYDYIQTIASYAGWELRYIHCGSFEECLKKVEAGEVDIFYDVSRTADREKNLLFPDEPMGYEYYYQIGRAHV